MLCLWIPVLQPYNQTLKPNYSLVNREVKIAEIIQNNVNRTQQNVQVIFIFLTS